MALNKKGIKWKLGVLVIASTSTLILFSIYSFTSMSQLKGKLEHIAAQKVPITGIKAGVHSAARHMWRSLSSEANSDNRTDSLKQVSEVTTGLSTSWEKIMAFKLPEDIRAKYVSSRTLLDQFSDTVHKGVDYLSENTPEDDAKAKALLVTKMESEANKLTEAIEELVNITNKKTAEFIEDANKSAQQAQFILLLFAVIAGVAVYTFGIVLASRLSGSLVRITNSVGDASSQVSAASEQLANSADLLSSNAQQQASALEETSASLTQIAGMVEANSKGAELANQTAKDVFTVTEDTCSSMEELANAMKSILESNQKIEKLVKIIESIGEKTEVIDEIVFETRLLSFNASVEAERAGEYGRGFAVVAQEVGNLAQMSGKAATEISTIVKQSIKEAEEVARENKNRVEMGGKLAQNTNESMAKVLEQIKSILEATGKIANASKEQTLGIGQITSSLDTLNQSTQQTAGTAVESASGSEELSGQANALMAQVEDLRNVVLGEGNRKYQEGSTQVQSSRNSHNHNGNHNSNNVVKLHSEPRKQSFKKVANAGMHEGNSQQEHSNDGWEKL